MKINKFQKAYNELTKEFANKYYWQEAYIERELEEEDYWLHPIDIADDFWDIGDIYQAMFLDIPREVVLSYPAFAMDDYQKNGKMTCNFYHYYLKNIKKL